MRTLYAFKNALTTCCLTAIVVLAAFGPASAQTTFGPFSASPALTITDDAYNGTLGSMVSSAIPVSGVTGASVINIEVDVNINHTWPGDLTLKLVSPDGDILTLLSRPGLAETVDDGTGCCGIGTDWLGSTVTFTDLGSADAETMTTPYSGTYFPNPGASTHPTQTFASLFGGSMNGSWTLYAGDAGGGDVGILNSWTIRITTVNPSLLAFIGVAVEDGNGDCSDDPLPATLTNTLNVAAGTNVCYFYYGENTGDVTLNLHDVNDDVFGALATGLPYALAPASAAFLAVGPVTINSTVTNNATWDAYNAGPTDLASSSASATVFLIPDNDLCADAIALTCGESVTGTTLGASDAGNNAALDCGELAGDLGVWYTFVGTGNQMSLSTCGPVSDVNDPVFMAVYTGGCGAFSCVINNSDLVPAVGCGFANGQELIFATTEGETYHVFVASWTGGTVDFDLSLDCADCNGDFGGTASLDCNGVCSGGNTGVAPANSITLDMTDDFGDGWNDATYQIYDNSDPLNPVLIASGDIEGAATGDGTGVGQDIFCLPDGCYLFTVGGGEWDSEIGWTLTGVDGGPLTGGAPESIAFSINTASCAVAGCTDPASVNYDPAATVDDGSCVYAPANDLCSGAIAVACGDVVSGTTIGASATDAPAGPLSISEGVWYSFVGTGGDITVSTCSANDFDTEISVSEGACGSLTWVGGNDDFCDVGSEYTFTSVAGTTYYIYIGDWSSDLTNNNAGTFDLSITCTAPPCDATAGTLVADASPVTLVGGSATISATEGTAPFVPAGYSVLYVLTQGPGLVIIDAAATPSFTVTAAGDYTIHTLVFDPATLDVTSVVFGTTTGFDVNGLLIQGGGTICGALDVAGAPIVVDEVVGINEGVEASLNVYPNPNNGQFIVELNGAEGVGTLNIMDMMGRRVYTAGVNFNGSFRQSIDVQLAAGTYLLQVKSEGQVLSRKINIK